MEEVSKYPKTQTTMISQTEITMADHEAANSFKPWVLLKEHDFQPGFGRIKGRMLFNVVAGDYTAGSTVTIQSMLDLGLRVEVVR